MDDNTNNAPNPILLDRNSHSHNDVKIFKKQNQEFKTDFNDCLTSNNDLHKSSFNLLSTKNKIKDKKNKEIFILKILKTHTACSSTYKFANLEVVKLDSALFDCLRSINGTFRLLTKYLLSMADNTFDKFYDGITDSASEFSNKNF